MAKNSRMALCCQNRVSKGTNQCYGLHDSANISVHSASVTVLGLYWRRRRKTGRNTQYKTAFLPFSGWLPISWAEQQFQESHNLIHMHPPLFSSQNTTSIMSLPTRQCFSKKHSPLYITLICRQSLEESEQCWIWGTSETGYDCSAVELWRNMQDVDLHLWLYAKDTVEMWAGSCADGNPQLEDGAASAYYAIHMRTTNSSTGISLCCLIWVSWAGWLSQPWPSRWCGPVAGSRLLLGAGYRLGWAWKLMAPLIAVETELG